MAFQEVSSIGELVQGWRSFIRSNRRLGRANNTSELTVRARMLFFGDRKIALQTLVNFKLH